MNVSKFLKIIISLLAGGYFIWLVWHPGFRDFFWGITFFVHEGGHMIFSLFGQFLHVAGGSITQTVIPILFIIYFWSRNQQWQSSIMMFWLGESLNYLSIYIGDAEVMRLPPALAEGLIHDWNYLLKSLDLLPYTLFISRGVWVLGFFCIISAMVIGLVTAKNSLVETPFEKGKS